MKSSIELKECYEDSPQFRNKVSEAEDALFSFEQNLKMLIKATRVSVEESLSILT